MADAGGASAEVEALRRQLEELKAENETLKEQVDSLEKTITELRAASSGQNFTTTRTGHGTRQKRVVSNAIMRGVMIFEQLINQNARDGAVAPPAPADGTARVSGGSVAARPDETREPADDAEPEPVVARSPRDVTATAMLVATNTELDRRVSKIDFEHDLEEIRSQVRLVDEDQGESHDNEEDDEDNTGDGAAQAAGSSEPAQPAPLQAAAAAAAAGVAAATVSTAGAAPVASAEAADRSPSEPAPPGAPSTEPRPVAAAAAAAAASPAPAAATAAAASASSARPPPPKQPKPASQEADQVVAIANQLREAQSKLPLLVAFLDKQSPHGLKLWQKRYCAVYDYELHYSASPFSMADVSDGTVRTDILRIPLVVVNSILSKPGSRIFTVQARDPKHGTLRDYQFRCPTEKETQTWVLGLNDHRNHLLSMLRWLTFQKGQGVEVSWN